MKKIIIALGCISAISHASANPPEVAAVPTCASKVRISSVSVGDLDNPQWSLDVMDAYGKITSWKSKYALRDPMGEILRQTVSAAISNHSAIDLENCDTPDSGFRTIKLYSETYQQNPTL